MKIIMSLLSLSSLLFTTYAYGGPCNLGYSCKSESGKYQIEFLRCQDYHNLTFRKVTISGKEINSAKQHVSWDGDHFLAFEIGLPTQDYDGQILTAELIKKDREAIGTIKEQVLEFSPGPFKTIFSEPVICRLVN